ncbi:MAG TPA: SDR family oxidoreductase [Acidimicrobiia bacterium]|nr:SDR family oxidoreductase [Acidimicrobiia bacterium]
MTRVALVTGGSRGLGKALTRSLLERGWTVVIDGRDREGLKHAVVELSDPALRAIEGDVSDGNHRRRLAEEIEDLGQLDLVVNNASFLGPSPQPRLDRYPPEVFREVFEVNVVAPLVILQEFLPLLRRSHGVVINVTSDAAVEGYEGWGGYGSSKAALEQLTRVLATEEPGISVYWIAPGDMNTRMQQEAFPGEDVSDRSPPEASVPGLLHLIEVRPPSGRYLARQIA